MSEHIMTATEIAELAELESKATWGGDWRIGFDEESIIGDESGGVWSTLFYLPFSRIPGITRQQDACFDDAHFVIAARNAVPRLIATIAAREAEIAQLKDLLREVSATSARIPANPVMATFSLNTLAKIDVALKESHND